MFPLLAVRKSVLTVIFMGELSLVFVIIPNLKFDRNFILICFANTLQICADFFSDQIVKSFPRFCCWKRVSIQVLGPALIFQPNSFSPIFLKASLAAILLKFYRLIAYKLFF